MNGVADRVGTHLVEPLGWTLVHSVWQLTLLAAIFAIAARMLRRRSAQLRYGLCGVTLFLMVSTTVVTHWVYLPPADTSVDFTIEADGHMSSMAEPGPFHEEFGAIEATPALPTPVFTQELDSPQPTVGLKSTAADIAALIEPLLPLVVVVWIAGVFVISIWNIGGWIAVQRMATLGTSPLPQAVHDRLAELSERMTIRRCPNVVESIMVRAPSVIGWFRPIVLLPLGIVSGLTPAQLDAVLAHELAHVRRLDYLANLLQTVVETLLFYHPGVRYVSRQMRAEREYCADLLAAEVVGDQFAYARALAAATEHVQSAPQFALAATGGSLINRVRRLFGLEINDGGRTGSWLFGAAGALVMVLLLVVVPSASALSASRDEHIALRRVWADATTDVCGRVSPDGRQIAYIDWDSGNLGVHNLQQSVSRLLTSDGTWEEPNCWAEAPIWSPDGKQLAYTCFQDDQPAQLRIVSLDAGPPRTVHTAEEGGSLYTADWTPDGGHILVGLRDADRRRRMALVNAVTGVVLHLQDLHTRDGGPEAVSPDGRFVAFTQGSNQAEGRDIFVYELAKGKSRPIIEHPANDRDPIWSPDGKWLTFLSDRTGSMAAWGARVEGGPVKDSVRQISPPLQSVVALGVTDRGEYFFGRLAPRELFAVEYDSRLEQVTGEPRRLVRRFEGRNYKSVWSPDGKKLAYYSHRPTPHGGMRVTVVVRDEATGEERISDLNVTPYHHLAWLPDGDLLIRATTDAREDVIYRWSIDRGTTVPVVTWPRQANEQVSLSFAVSRDGSTLFYSTVDNGTVHIVRRQLEDGQEQSLAAMPAMNNPQLSLSPGGRLLALVAHSSIWLVDLDSGALRPLHELQEKKNQSIRHGITWTPDGQQLIFAMAGGDPQRPRTSSLWRIAVEEGEPQPLGVTRQCIEHLDMHPEGKQLAFSAGGDADGAEVWAFESSLLTREE